MTVYAIYERYGYYDDEEIRGPIHYAQAENKQEVEEIFPFADYQIKEINIETVNWLKIQKQIQETLDVQD
jgi:hypothetical protein